MGNGYQYRAKEDCIHLKACRRMVRIARSKHLIVPKYCSDQCTCYEAFEEVNGLVTVEDAVNYAIQGEDYVLAGYDVMDVYTRDGLYNAQVPNVGVIVFKGQE